MNNAQEGLTAAILTVSDRCAAGLQRDESGPALASLLAARWPALHVAESAVVADEVSAIQAVVQRWVDGGIALILTTGGTGFAPRDTTSEAVRPLLDRETPGLAHAMLSASLAVTPHAMLSRPVAGIRAQSLIVTLPGSPKGATENLTAILPALPHGLRLLREVGEESTRHKIDEPRGVG
ncbi:MAG: MogA/MoaB family molybdenum cofactor biosynthesis protein [Ardenticatenales bacterium]|nr:MogA/MoaB family molybdenum cofactor biosynthesis protein [Ardenticatenales bacterium]